MSLVTQLNSFVTRVGTEFKTVYATVGALTGLTTTNKGSVVAAVNEVNGKFGSYTPTAGLAAVALSGNAGDLTGVLPSSALPPLAISATTVVADQAAMLALSAQVGDIAKRTDLNGTPFILAAEPATTLGNWVALDTTSDVSSVNGQTGTVVLNAGHVGAQPADTDLTAIAALVSAANTLPYATGAGTWALTTLTAFARTLLDDVDAATARGTLGAQAADATLTALAGVTVAANQLIYATGADTFAVTGLTAFARTLLDDVDAATARGTLSVYSQAEVGDPATDFVAAFNAALV